MKTATSSRSTPSTTRTRRGGDPADGRKVKGATIHWVDAATALDAEVRVYSELFSDPAPDGADKDFLACMNPDSLEVLTGCKVEPRMRDIAAAYDRDRKEGQDRAELPVHAPWVFLP